MRLNGTEIAVVNSGDPPCELMPSRWIDPGTTLEFVDAADHRHVHDIGDLSGWAHFSLRVHAGLACQADCAITSSETYDPKDLLDGQGKGIRFQPFFLPGAAGSAEELRGQGLFQRGLHFSGTVTPGSVRLSCECDDCHHSFQLQSFHAGFGNVGYMYSGSGIYTLIIDGNVAGAPPAMGTVDRLATEQLEKLLLPAPDGTRFAYLNALRCPHCRVPYINFEEHPKLRENEYYGNYLIGSEPLHYPPKVHENPKKRSWFNRISES